MPTFTKRSSRFHSSQWPFPAIFTKPVPVETPAIHALRRKFFRDRDAATRNELFEMYAPLVLVVALKLKRRKPSFYRDTAVDLLSDGSLGLLSFIHHNSSHERFTERALSSIHQAILTEVIRRNFGIPMHRFRASNEMQNIRQQLIQQLGRMPTPDEFDAELRTRITNPLFQIGRELRPVKQPGTLTADDEWEMENAQDSSPAAMQPLLNEEVLRLAKKGLSGIDLKLFKLVMQGQSLKEIVALLAIPHREVKARVAGILWQARCRADLANYLEATPSERQASTAQCNPGERFLPDLKREHRTDAAIGDLLRRGYSQKTLVRATRGTTDKQKRRISAIAHVVEYHMPPLRLAAG